MTTHVTSARPLPAYSVPFSVPVESPPPRETAKSLLTERAALPFVLGGAGGFLATFALAGGLDPTTWSSGEIAGPLAVAAAFGVPGGLVAGVVGSIVLLGIVGVGTKLVLGRYPSW